MGDEKIMIKAERWRLRRAGALAGFIAALALTAVQGISRLNLGASLPGELAPDRFLPFVPVAIFIDILNVFGGSNTAKTVAYFAAFLGQFVVGAVIGVIYASITGAQAEKRPDNRLRFGLNARAVGFVFIAMAVIWAVLYLVFNPVLVAGYSGERPEVAAMTAAEALLASFLAYGVVLVIAFRFIGGASGGAVSPDVEGPNVGRRTFVTGLLGVGLAVFAGDAIRRLYTMGAFGYDGTQVLGPHIDPLTPNDKFYVVTKNLIDPHIDPGAQTDDWRFELRGLIDKPDDFNIDEIKALPSTVQETTIECISNPVGGGLISNARWTGVPLHTLIENASPRSGVKAVRIQAVDGYTHFLSYEKAMEPTTLLAYEMNGQALPQRHGYPARLIVPGYYGEGSMKWITQVALVSQEEGGYYESQGWRDRNVHTMSRIDLPEKGQVISLHATPVVQIAGVAFAADRGVEHVEVSTDGGQTWHDARITYKKSNLTWALWRYDWRPSAAATYKLVVRATDGTGAVQTAAVMVTDPQGATGYHEVMATIQA